MNHVEKDVPWVGIASFLNILAQSNEIDPRSEDPHFPQPEKGVGRPLPEDFAIDGQSGAKATILRGGSKMQ